MKQLRGAIIGCGFWSRYQIPAWQELEGVVLVAAYNRTLAKAEHMAHQFGIARAYNDIGELFRQEEIDFVDIITDVDTHASFVERAAAQGIAVICQKPMAPDLVTARRMVDICAQANIPFFIHENFRWQAPIRAVKDILNTGVIGRPFKGRVSFCSGFPVFENQPFLAQLDQFILTDIGSHILDVCRFLFGEVETLYCQTDSVNPGIQGEDVANVLMRMVNGVQCYAEMSYASVLENETFPQTLILIEGEKGSISLGLNFEIRVTLRSGAERTTELQKAEPKLYPWLDPNYAVVHASIVDTNRDILQALQGKGSAETTGKDNFKTVQLVFGAYESAKTRSVVHMRQMAAL